MVDGTTLAYDANGNMLTGLNGRSITYDYANRPTSVSHAGQTTGFTYDGTGGRQSKVVDGVTTFYAGMAEIRNFGTPQEQLILQPHADFRLVDGVASYLHRDHLASVRAITDASGALVERTAYTPYGAEDNDPALANPIPEEHGFIGERFDASTGMQYLNARYYDPDLGRFIQPDWCLTAQARFPPLPVNGQAQNPLCAAIITLYHPKPGPVAMLAPRGGCDKRCRKPERCWHFASP